MEDINGSLGCSLNPKVCFTKGEHFMLLVSAHLCSIQVQLVCTLGIQPMGSYYRLHNMYIRASNPVVLGVRKRLVGKFLTRFSCTVAMQLHHHDHSQT